MQLKCTKCDRLGQTGQRTCPLCGSYLILHDNGKEESQLRIFTLCLTAAFLGAILIISMIAGGHTEEKVYPSSKSTEKSASLETAATTPQPSPTATKKFEYMPNPLIKKKANGLDWSIATKDHKMEFCGIQREAFSNKGTDFETEWLFEALEAFYGESPGATIRTEVNSAVALMITARKYGQN